MRKRVVFISIILILATVAFFALRKEKVYKFTSGTNIIAFGDSLVAGQGAGPGGDFPSVLSQKLDLPVINAGKNGDTSASALLRLQDEVMSLDPKIVIILLGGNDFFQRLPMSTTLANLSTIIDAIKSRGAAPVLLGFEGSFLLNYDKEYKKLAKQKNIPFVPNVLKGIFNRPELMADAIHPNNAGYAKMAEKIEPVVRNLLK